MWDPMKKIAKAKRTGGVAQIVECPSVRQWLSSNSSTAPKKLKKKLYKLHEVFMITVIVGKFQVVDLYRFFVVLIFFDL
jgi:hypothetical protein